MENSEFLDFIRQNHCKRLLIGGHRGHLSETRENTIPNFEEVFTFGVDYMEIDIQLSGDDQAVIFHDRDLSEKTPLSGSVRDHSVKALKNSFDLCTLDEAIAWCKAKRMRIMLEIKSRDYGPEERSILAGKIADAIQRNRYQAGCILLSIDYEILRMIKDMIPEISLALIVPKKPDHPAALMKQMRASVYLSYLEDLDKDLVKVLHQAGYLVDGSVVNTKAQLECALSLKVDMIESDFPDQILELYNGINKQEDVHE